MRISVEGNYVFQSNQDTVWHNIIDPNLLKDAIPSCKKITLVNSGKYLATAEAKIGFIKLSFDVDVSLKLANDSYHYILEAQVIDGVAKNTTISSNIHLNPIKNSSTELVYKGHANISDNVRYLGESVIIFATKKWLNMFFKRLDQTLIKDC